MATQYADYRQNNADIEAQPGSATTAYSGTATSAYSVPVYSNNAAGSGSTTIIYAIPQNQVDYEIMDMRDPHQECLPCAIVGFIFSWIPIIGIATWIFNMDAPRNTMRSIFSQSACCVATFVIIFNIIFWSAYRL